MKAQLNPRIFRLLLLLSLASLAGLPDLQAQDEDGLVVLEELPMGAGVGHGEMLYVTLRLNNQSAPLLFMIDTGSGGSALDETLAPELGKQIDTTVVFDSAGTAIVVRKFKPPALFLGKKRLLAGDSVETQDLKPFRDASGHPVMGVLGMDYMSHCCLQLDFDAGKMRFKDSRHAAIKFAGRSFPMKRSHEGFWLVQGNVLGLERVDTIIDSGDNSGGALVPRLFDEAVRSHSAAVTRSVPFASTSGTNEGRQRALLPYALNGGGAYSDLLLARGFWNTVGLRFLARYNVTFDFPRMTMHLAPRKTALLPEEADGLASPPAGKGGESVVSGTAKTNDVDKVLAELTEAIRLHPNDGLGFSRRGLIYQLHGEWDKALADLSAAIRLNPKYPNAWVMRASVFGQKGEYDRAISDHTEGIRLDPHFTEAYKERGLACWKNGELDKALTDLTEAIRLDSQYAEAWDWRALVEAKQGNSAQAIADFTEAIRLDPKCHRVFYDRGTSYFVMGKFDQAIADFDEAIRIDPDDGDAYNNRGQTHYVKQELDKAMSDFNAAIQRDPTNTVALGNRALLSGQQGEFARAISDYTELLRLSPDNFFAHANRGASYQHDGVNDKAVADFTEAIRLNPLNSEIFERRGVCHALLREFDKAIADLSEAVRLTPNADSAFFARGNCFFEKGEMKPAIRDYTEALRLSPGNPAGYASRSQARLKAGEYAGALADAREAVRLDPGNSFACGMIAWALAVCPEAGLRDGAKAMEYATKACELTQWKQGDLLDVLAAACAESDNFDEAVKWEKQALAAGVPKSDEEEARHRLAHYEQKKPWHEKRP